MSVRVDRESDASVCVVRLDGDVDMSVVPSIREKLTAAVASGCTTVVLDMTLVSYADSSALGLLVWLDRLIEPLGGRVVIAGADRNVARVLELSGLVGVAPSLAMAAGVDEALAGLELRSAPASPLQEEEIVVPADPEGMGRVRRQVCGMVETVGMSESALFDLKVALGEALANAVRHGSPGGTSDEIRVTVRAYADRVVVSIRDRGTGFDGTSGSGDDVYSSSGRGLLFMRALMDRVEFESVADGSGTIVHLTKCVPAIVAIDRSGADEQLA